MISRQTVREALAVLLRLRVTAAQIVYDHEPGDLGGQSPAIVVSVGGSARPDFTFAGNRTSVYLFVDVYTLAAETESGAYTYSDSADVIDSVEQQIADAVVSAQENGTWNRLEYDGRSTVDFGMFDSIPYFRERIPLIAHVFA